jgi:hypothetical protein
MAFGGVEGGLTHIFKHAETPVRWRNKSDLRDDAGYSIGQHNPLDIAMQHQ